jgi:hypothetical protein
MKQGMDGHLANRSVSWKGRWKFRRNRLPEEAGSPLYCAYPKLYIPGGRVRISTSLLLCLSFLVCGCHSASSNPLIGTWITADDPIPAGCSSKIIFTEKTMYYESPGIPGLLPASKGTVNILYGGDPNQQKLIVVENPATMVMDDWSLSDPKHAISGSVAQCHYVKQ